MSHPDPKRSGKLRHPQTDLLQLGLPHEAQTIDIIGASEGDSLKRSATFSYKTIDFERNYEILC